MRSTILLGAVVATGIIGCSSGGGVQVRTSVEPNADLAALHTFYVLPAPTRSANAPLPANDPMLDNSITNRALRGDLTTALQARGSAPTSRRRVSEPTSSSHIMPARRRSSTRHTGDRRTTPAGGTRTAGAGAGRGRIVA